jgi:TonB family protein
MVETEEPKLLEVHLGKTKVYLRPSWWQSIRLRWVFRHFRELPPELIGRGNLRLINKLAHSAVVRPARPVPRDQILGIVEKAIDPTLRKPPARAVPGRMTIVERWPERTENYLAPAWSENSRWQALAASLSATGGFLAWIRHRRSLQQYRGLAVLAAACLVVILVKVAWQPNRDFTSTASSQPAQSRMAESAAPSALQPNSSPGAKAAAVAQTAPPASARAAAAPLSGALKARAAVAPLQSSQAPQNGSSGQQVGLAAVASTAAPAAAPSAPSVSSAPSASAVPGVPAVETQPALAQPEAAPAQSQQPAAQDPLALAPGSSSASTAPPQPASTEIPVATENAATQENAGTNAKPVLFEMPEGHIVYPALSNPNFVGAVTLQAVIGADGSVKDVSVVSGDPNAAAAAVSAVRHWRYAPAISSGQPVEGVTNIGISFFGRDALSVSPVH